MASACSPSDAERTAPFSLTATGIMNTKGSTVQLLQTGQESSIYSPCR